MCISYQKASISKKCYCARGKIYKYYTICTMHVILESKFDAKDSSKCVERKQLLPSGNLGYSL